jgi:Tol biopolymer transport system component
LLLLLVALPVLAAGLMKIERISPPPLDLDVTLPSGSPAISDDGRFVVFVSDDSAPLLGSSSFEEIFVRDRQTGTTALLSVAPDGAPVDGESSSPAISGDGRSVAFESYASNLVPGDTNDTWDVFMWDRQTGKTEVISVSSSGAPANDWSGFPAISGAGRFVAFAAASSLLPGGASGGTDVFVAERG